VNCVVKLWNEFRFVHTGSVDEAQIKSCQNSATGIITYLQRSGHVTNLQLLFEFGVVVFNGISAKVLYKYVSKQ
jgi:hypothetical protein